MIPIQITNNSRSNLQSNLQSTNMGPGFDLINGKNGLACHGFNGNLNSWYYGLKPEFQEYLYNQYLSVGKLAQLDTVNSPYYTQVEIDPRYIQYLQNISKC